MNTLRSLFLNVPSPSIVNFRFRLQDQIGVHVLFHGRISPLNSRQKEQLLLVSFHDAVGYHLSSLLKQQVELLCELLLRRNHLHLLDATYQLPYVESTRTPHHELLREKLLLGRLLNCLSTVHPFLFQRVLSFHLTIHITQLLLNLPYLSKVLSDRKSVV